MDNVQSSQPTQSIPSSDIPNSKPKSKILWIVLGVILILSAVTGSYFLGKQSSKVTTQNMQPSHQVNQPSPTTIISLAVSQTPDVTASWKTYTNTQSNYSVSYPPSWSLATSTTPDGKTEADLTYIERGKQYHFVIAQGGSGGPDTDNIQDETVTYAGKSFIRRTWIKFGKPIFISIIPNNNDTRFNHIEITLSPVNTDKYIMLFNQILSTLKFKQ